MTLSPIEHTQSLRIGTVEFVSPDEIKVLLDIEAPESVALNAGIPRSFPRVNNYVLIPNDEGYLVGQVEWLSVERSAFPKRRGMQDFGLVDLPYPLRKMSLNPLGTLRKTENEQYRFRRGVEAFPSIGDGVLIPTDHQLKSIIESSLTRKVTIGTSPLANNASICIDPDRLFGRHLAVLGNTGSGKSCSVAGLIRWSLEEAAKNMSSSQQIHPNARYIILDPNGEYARAFHSEENTCNPFQPRIFRVGDENNPLQIPLWFWNSAEWCSFAQASAKTQRPALIQALRFAREGRSCPTQPLIDDVKCFLRTILTTLRLEKNSGSPWGKFPSSKNFYEKIEKWKSSLVIECTKLESNSSELKTLSDIIVYIETLATPRKQQYANYDFTKDEVDTLIDKIMQAFLVFGGSRNDIVGIDVDAPIPFEGETFLHILEATSEMLGISNHAETLLMRIRGLLSDSRMKPIISDNGNLTLEQWLDSYLQNNQTTNNGACLTIIDLSLVPTEVVHIIVAVTARMIFEALQRYRKIHSKSLPTVLVMEEAHTFIKRYKDDLENQDAASVCCQVFEKIAREGRKFGLGLVLSSQRPSELSPTVLSQCNSFLLHRINNDRDQELIHRLIPDNLRGLLRELPSLPSQNAILLGWASELPVLVRMNDLPEEHQPQSSDPDFWDVWTRKQERSVDWDTVAKDWQQRQG